jgi:GDP-L-fucose synthase
METYSDEAIVNAGWGKDISIAELAELVKKIVGYEGAIAWDRDKPDGTPRKLLDCTRIFATGWKPTIELEQGIADTYRWYMQHVASGANRAHRAAGT